MQFSVIEVKHENAPFLRGKPSTTVWGTPLCIYTRVYMWIFSRMASALCTGSFTCLFRCSCVWRSHARAQDITESVEFFVTPVLSVVRTSEPDWAPRQALSFSGHATPATLNSASFLINTMALI